VPLLFLADDAERPLFAHGESILVREPAALNPKVVQLLESPGLLQVGQPIPPPPWDDRGTQSLKGSNLSCFPLRCVVYLSIVSGGFGVTKDLYHAAAST
jgi:hypothetical protein